MKSVYLGVGGNLGNVEQTINRCLVMLNTDVCQVSKVSPFYVTKAWGNVAEGDFLNAVIKINTSLTPWQLLDFLQQIETKLGRVRTKRWGDRTIDLDILIYDKENIRDQRLQIPHPYMTKRAFVLVPLLDIYDGEQINYFKQCLNNLATDERNSLKRYEIEGK